MGRRSVAGSLGAIAVMVAVLVWRQWHSPAEEPFERDVAAKCAARDGASDSGLTASPPLVAVRVEAIRPATADGDADAIAGTPRRIAEPGPAGGLSIRVVDDRTGEPVAGAEVIVASRRTRNYEGPHSLWVDPEELRSRARGIYLADDRGEALLPWPSRDDAPLLYCFHSGASGCVLIRRATSLLLRLYAPQHVDVRVVGCDGRPRGGVPVAFGAGLRDHGFYPTTPIVRTGSDGMARIHGIELREREWTSFWGVGVPDTIEGVPFASIDTEALPRETVELEVPHTSEIVVRLVDSSGRVVDRSGSVMVTSADRNGNYASLAPREIDFVHGVARGALARPGRVVYVSPLEPALDEPRFVEIPEAAGPEVVVDFVAPLEEPQLLGRVVDESGVPVANRELWYRCREEARAVTTDAEGRFRTAAPRFLGNRYGSEGVLLDLDTNGRSARLVRFAIPSRRVGEIDVGALSLVARALVVAGRVVDDAGAPVEGASFRFFHHDSSGDAECTDSFAPRQDRTGADGRFAWFGNAPTRELTIEVESAAVGSGRSEVFTAGESDLVVALTRTGRVVGSFVTDGGIPSSRLPPSRLKVTLFAPDDDRWSPHESFNEEGGAFTISNVRPGRWTFRASLASNGFDVDVPLLTIPDVVVGAGEIVRDSRLQALDVRGLLPIRVRICDERGNRIEGDSFVLVRTCDGRRLVSESSVWQGRKELLVAEPDVLVEAWARGFRRAARVAERGTMEFRLERGDEIGVHLTLAEESARSLTERPELRCVHVALVPKDSPPRTEVDWLEASLDGRADVTFRVSEAGGWELRAYAGDGPKHGIPVEASPSELDLGHRDHVDVAVSLKLDSLRAAIEELSRRQ